MKSAEYRFYPMHIESIFEPNKHALPDIVIKAGTMSKEFNLILKGTIFLMNKECVYDYCQL